MTVDTETAQPSPSEVGRRPRSLSGVKATGTPHLGNYLGMIRPAVALQETHDAFYFVADYHALTTERDPDAMRRSTREITATFLAFGLDPARASFFRQSDVPEVCELTWMLSCVTTMGELERAHAYKAARDAGIGGRVGHGLFAYPVLMAADILIYHSDVVPVGRDQVQHVEIARDMAKRVNHLWGDLLVVPQAKVQEAVATVPGIDGRKMSKSYDNGVDVFLPPKQLRKRLMRIVTDSTPLEEPKDATTCPVVALYRYFAGPEQVAEMEAAYREGGYGYGHAKQALFEAVDAHLAPHRERYEALMADPDSLEDVLRDGARRARGIALDVMGRVRERVGLPRHPHPAARS